MKKKLFLIVGTIIISLIIVGAVYAFQIGNVDGVWGLIDENYELPCQDATSLFFSEYVYEARLGTDRVLLEIYNGTGATINLSTYSVELFNSPGGSNTVALSNVNLSDDDVYVLVNSGSTGETPNEDQTFPDNEDYATIVLLNGITVVDVIGDINNPNTEIPSTDEDRTFRRDLNVCAGDTDGDTGYNEWTIQNSYVTGDIGFYQGADTDPNENDATCSNWATGPTGNDPNGTTGLTISNSYFGQIPPNTDFNQIRYGSMDGDCLDFDEQSGMAFDGSNLQSPNPQFGEQVPFLLGKFCHINHPIQAANALQTIHNQMTLTDIKCDPAALDVDADPTSLTFDYMVELDETPNELPCTYPSTTPCADRISAPQADPQFFRCYYEGDVYVDYTVALVGFIPLDDPNGGCSNDFFDEDDVTGIFISNEGTTNCGCVFGMITDNTPTAVELKSFEVLSTDEGIELVWETASEIDNLGFNIYRANRLYGTKTKINPELIESLSPGGTAGARYTYLDKTTIGGYEYFYWLEDIESGGDRSALNGPAIGISAAPSWRYFLPVLTASGTTDLR